MIVHVVDELLVEQLTRFSKKDKKAVREELKGNAQGGLALIIDGSGSPGTISGAAIAMRHRAVGEKCKGIECLNVGPGVWRDGRTLNNQLKFRS
jgi:hypothetical protein